MKFEKFITHAIAFLLGMAVAIIIAMVLAMAEPAKKPACNDGYSTQVENGIEYKTYIPALDTCKK